MSQPCRWNSVGVASTLYDLVRAVPEWQKFALAVLCGLSTTAAERHVREKRHERGIHAMWVYVHAA
jgi:hypothetical protein